MRNINEDIRVNGKISARALDGEPSEQLAERIMEIVREVIAPEFEALRQEIAEFKKECADKSAALETKYTAAVEQFNAAADEVNKMSERLVALEANYDPTVVK